MDGRKLAAVLLAAVSARAADPDLLKLVSPEARAVYGIDVAKVRDTRFGKFLLAQFTEAKDKEYDGFVKASGFDPATNLDEVLIAMPDAEGRRLIAARGRFEPARIIALAREAGVPIGALQGIPVIRGPAMSVAFLSPAIGLAGDAASVDEAIGRREGGPGPIPALAEKIRTLSASNDAWFVCVVPFFKGTQPPWLASIEQANGGVKLGDFLELTAELRTQSAGDVAAALKALFGSLDIKTDGDTVRLALTLPEAQAEALFQNPGQYPHSPVSGNGE
jgi:hypothetical protein